MRQVARRLKDGRVELVEVADPSPGPGTVAVRVGASVLSAGTERATLDTASKNLLQKARARPDQARQVIEKARAVGVRETAAFVRRRLDELGPLGYSAAGEVIEVGPAVRGLSPSDRVAIGGGGMASHAEIDVVSSLLCARIPDRVSDEQAAFATLGAIAMHGFRRAEVEVGSRVAVIGLGLIGQLAVRVARAAGCRVLGIDLRSDQLDLAGQAGAEVVLRPEVKGAGWHGTADAILICAATSSTDPIALATELARDRAPVVVVGDVKMDLERAPFYDKEIDLRLSRSYGPGRYDPGYEIHGVDYPVGYVRWTEQRNMTAFLELVADGKIDPSELVTHRFPFADAEQGFALLTSGEPVCGIVLEYPRGEQQTGRPAAAATSTDGRPSAAGRDYRRSGAAKPRFGLVGAGSFATGTLIPGLLAAGFEPKAIVSDRGLSAESARGKFGFEAAHGRVDDLLAREDIDLLVVATRHDSHASIAARGLDAGLPVYVEKPLALSYEELAMVREAQRAHGAPLIVGFNRRHAPLAAQLRDLGGPRMMFYRVNAGPIEPSHWTNDLARGGGRLLGEGCHFIDFLCNQAGADPLTAETLGFPSDPALPRGATDNFSVRLSFADGSLGTIHYAADAPTGPGKERFELSAPGVHAVLEDFRGATVWSPQRRRYGGRGQDKGFAGQYAYLAEVLGGAGEAPDADDMIVSSLATLAAARSLETGQAERIVLGSDD